MNNELFKPYYLTAGRSYKNNIYLTIYIYEIDLLSMVGKLTI